MLSDQQRFFLILLILILIGFATYIPFAGIEGKRETGAVEMRIDLNEAEEAELSLLPGVGPTLAKRIIQYRSENGKFNTIDEIQKINGIGEKKSAKIIPYLKH